MNVTKELYDELVLLSESIHNEQGMELLNPKPVAVPGGLQKPMSLDERIQRAIRGALSHQAVAQGEESFEDANDFDIPSEQPEPLSGYEVVEMTPETPLQEHAPNNNYPLSEGSSAPTAGDDLSSPSSGISPALPDEAKRTSSPSPVDEEAPPPRG
jgi:hypothetical protein